MAYISKSFPLRNICVSLDREIIVHMILCVLYVIQALLLCPVCCSYMKGLFLLNKKLMQ